MWERQNGQMVRDFDWRKLVTAVDADSGHQDSLVFHTSTNELEGQLNDAGQKAFTGKHFKLPRPRAKRATKSCARRV